jgi:signal transduction histidine kinase
MEDADDEILRLRGCVNDLVGLLALPAMWRGLEQAQMANTLLDVLVEMLGLDFAYVRLKGPVGTRFTESFRSAEPGNPIHQSPEIGQTLNQWLGFDTSRWPARVRKRLGGGVISIATAQLGLRDEIGVIALGSQRVDFPVETERLILSVAANQAAIGLQDARRSEDALNKLRAELAHVARVTTLGALTASIAHEVNQPLSGIITNTSTCLRMLAADPPNIDGARETARRAIRDGNRAADVIARLRKLFRKQGSGTELVDLNEAAREVLALSFSELQRQEVSVRAEFLDSLPAVCGDRVQLQQVILNLLLNASEAMCGVNERARQLKIWTRYDDNDVHLSVQDTGVGVDAQRVDRLFEPFYTSKPDGMGMGLSVSRSIIESHHGRLWAAPNDGPGSTFAFSIPRAEERDSSTKVASQVSMVDDDESVRESLPDLPREMGFTVQEF